MQHGAARRRSRQRLRGGPLHMHAHPLAQCRCRGRAALGTLWSRARAGLQAAAHASKGRRRRRCLRCGPWGKRSCLLRAPHCVAQHQEACAAARWQAALKLLHSHISCSRYNVGSGHYRAAQEAGGYFCFRGLEGGASFRQAGHRSGTGSTQAVGRVAVALRGGASSCGCTKFRREGGARNQELVCKK